MADYQLWFAAKDFADLLCITDTDASLPRTSPTTPEPGDLYLYSVGDGTWFDICEEDLADVLGAMEGLHQLRDGNADDGVRRADEPDGTRYQMMDDVIAICSESPVWRPFGAFSSQLRANVDSEPERHYDLVRAVAQLITEGTLESQRSEVGCTTYRLTGDDGLDDGAEQDAVAQMTDEVMVLLDENQHWWAREMITEALCGDNGQQRTRALGAALSQLVEGGVVDCSPQYDTYCLRQAHRTAPTDDGVEVEGGVEIAGKIVALCTNNAEWHSQGGIARRLMVPPAQVISLRTALRQLVKDRVLEYHSKTESYRLVTTGEKPTPGSADNAEVTDEERRQEDETRTAEWITSVMSELRAASGSWVMFRSLAAAFSAYGPKREGQLRIALSELSDNGVIQHRGDTYRITPNVDSKKPTPSSLEVQAENVILRVMSPENNDGLVSYWTKSAVRTAVLRPTREIYRHAFDRLVDDGRVVPVDNNNDRYRVAETTVRAADGKVDDNG